MVNAYREKGVTVKDEWVEELKEINGTTWKMEIDITRGEKMNSALRKSAGAPYYCATGTRSASG